METIRLFSPNVYAIDSFNGNGSYLVDVGENPRCTCPQWVHRCAGTDRQCKHQVAVEKYVRAEQFQEFCLKAGTLEDAELLSLIDRYEAKGRRDIALALRAEAWDREQLRKGASAPPAPAQAPERPITALSEAERKAIFA